MELDAVAKRYGRRPSEIAGIANVFAAWTLDRAAAFEGMKAEADAIKRSRG